MAVAVAVAMVVAVVVAVELVVAQSVLQKEDGIIMCQVWYFSSWENQATYIILGY